MTQAKAWLAASRPHTLSAAAVPVLVGAALSAGAGPFPWGVFALILAGALLVQVGANLTDEYADHGSTGSANKYLAPHKVIAHGLLSEGAVKRGAFAVFTLATLIGLLLVWRTGWPLLLVCLLSLAVAWAYSAGPLPLGDLALGEVLVFIVMGPVMVVSTAYVLLLHWPPHGVWLSIPVGALVTAILVVNNLRDEPEDRANERQTLVTLFGRTAGVALYHGLLLLAFGMVAVAGLLGWQGHWVLLPLATLPLAWRLSSAIRAPHERERLHAALRRTSALHAIFGLLLAQGLVMENLGQ